MRNLFKPKCPVRPWEYISPGGRSNYTCMIVLSQDQDIHSVSHHCCFCLRFTRGVIIC
jgi:hypothetical protein